MPLTMIVTDAGRAAIVNAENSGTDPVTITECGLSGSVITADATMTALAGEFKRIATLSGDVVDDDTIHMIVRDEGMDAYTVRAWALYLADGTLFGIFGQSDPLIEKTSSSAMLLAIDVRFADINAASLIFGDTNFLNPPATTEALGVVELATETEAIAGADAQRAVVPAAMQAAVNNWLDARFGAGNSGIWHPGNDGAGSAMDADTVDGLHANAFLLAASFTASAIKAMLLTVDGAGSGVDADTVDGVHAASFLRADAEDTASELITFSKGLVATGGIHSTDGLITSISGGLSALSTSENVDHIWHDDGANTWHFCSDAPHKTGGNSKLATGGVTVNGFSVWHPGNDGAGSTLDSDLLDGQHGSYYLSLSNSTGTLPDARLSGSYSGITQISLSRIRLSSTLDASPTSTGHAFQIGSDSGENLIIDSNEIMARDNGAGTSLYIQYGANCTTGDFTKNGLPYWHPGNDGAGSAMDADTVDGLHASAFAKLADYVFNKGGSGRHIWPGGFTVMWGYATVNGNAYTTVDTPYHFGTAMYGALVSGGRLGENDAKDNDPTFSNVVDTNSFRVWNSRDEQTQIFFLAIGDS